MSGILGGKSKGNANVVTKYTQLDVNTSAYGLPIAIGWGSFRVAPNLIWTGNFKAIPQKSGGGKGSGGKGGSGKGSSSPTSYKYTAAVAMAFCEGPIQEINTVWISRDQLAYADAVSQKKFPGTLFLGDPGQATWSFLTTEDPANAIGFSSTAYSADSDLDLGTSPVVPNYGVEIFGTFYGTIPGWPPDALPSDVINDLLTNEQYGIGFGPAVGVAGSFIDQTSFDFYASYVQAAGFFLSPVLDSVEQVSAILDRWAQLTNSWIFWSGGALKFVPLGDTTITNHSATYTPDNTAKFDLGYEDFIRKGDASPVTIKLSKPADRPNAIDFEIENRSIRYEAFPIRWQDDGLVGRYGRITGPSVQAHDIKDAGIASVIAELLGRRAAYINRFPEFSLGWGIGCQLEPGDILTLTEPHIGLDHAPVRVQSLDEDKDGIWRVVTEEFTAGIGTAYGFQVPQGAAPNYFNTLVDPGDVNPPMIVEPDSSFTGGLGQIWASASGGANWGGAIVHLSLDNVNYSQIGEIENGARQGLLTAGLASHADPDTVNTLSVDLTESLGAIDLSSTHADADAGRTLCWITPAFSTVIPCDGELLAYGDAAAAGPAYNFDLSYLRRGLYGSTIASHLTGAFFSRFDVASQVGGSALNTAVYNLPLSYIGATLYLKFQSFNRFGGGLQDLSTVTAYTYVPCGHGYGSGPGGIPQIPTGLTATGLPGAVALTWDANRATDNVTEYKVFRAVGPAGSFGAATLVMTTPALGWTDEGLTGGDIWTYFLEACNVVGCSAPTAGVDATVLPLTSSALPDCPALVAMAGGVKYITLGDLSSDATETCDLGRVTDTLGIHIDLGDLH